MDPAVCAKPISFSNGGSCSKIKIEISTMRLVKHPNIIQLAEVMASKTKIYFVLEYVTGGELFNKIVKSAGKESLQCGLGAGVYTGVTYGLEVRGTHDWKNAAIAGALTGASVALTHDEPNHDIIVQSAITGAALSTAVSVLNKMF